MSIFLNREMLRLKKRVLHLGSVVENNVHAAVQAVEKRDVKLAEKIVNGDAEVDRIEVEIEEECLKILALYQPVAIDLRYVTAWLKMNNDLERIGDLAVNIAKYGLEIAAEDKERKLPVDFREMTALTMNMLRDSLRSLFDMNLALATEVRELERIIGDLSSRVCGELLDKIEEKPKRAVYYIRIISVARQLERVAELAVNIAEDVHYMGKGEIIRHQDVLNPESADEDDE